MLVIAGMRRNKRIIGITGGIASGKSTVSALLRDRGFPVVDADRIARKVVEPGEPALDRIREVFGEDMIDGSGRLRRKVLGNLVFSDEEARRQLDEIMKPFIDEEIERQIRAIKGSLVFLDAPLLFEWGMQSRVDITLLVAVEEETQIRRLMKRDGLDRQAALDRIRSQMSLDEKRQLADVIIENDGGLESLWTKITDFIEKLRKM